MKTGVETKQLKTSYSTVAGTAYVTFDNVKVPVENTLGEVDAGLLVMLSNFNHERYVSLPSTRNILIQGMYVWVTRASIDVLMI